MELVAIVGMDEKVSVIGVVVNNDMDNRITNEES